MLSVHGWREDYEYCRLAGHRECSISQPAAFTTVTAITANFTRGGRGQTTMLQKRNGPSALKFLFRFGGGLHQSDVWPSDPC